MHELGTIFDDFEMKSIGDNLLIFWVLFVAVSFSLLLFMFDMCCGALLGSSGHPFGRS